MNKPSIRSRKFRRRSARSAFTLLELLLVLAILVVLGGIVAVNVVGTNEAAMQDATTTQMKMLKQNIDMYRIRINGLPETLNSLVEGPSDASKKAKWVSPIIDSVPKDAWGNDFQYEVSGNTFEIRSGGIDGQLNTEDDIVVTS